MKKRLNPSRSGHYESVRGRKHFIPARLPFAPPLAMDMEMIELYGQAMRSLGRFQESCQSQEKFFVLDAFVAREAALSSRIEGIDAELLSVAQYNARQKSPDKETQEVLNYGDALHYAVRAVRDEARPVSALVLRKAQSILMTGGQKKRQPAGQFRDMTITLGSLVPPQAYYLEELMANLEKHINEDRKTLPLIRTAIAQAQFEAIFPFTHENGRMSRMLTMLCLLHYGLLREPVLCLSWHFRQSQSEYGDRLDAIRVYGDWEGWVKYYLRGIRVSADDVCSRIDQAEELQQLCIRRLSSFGRAAANAFKLLDQLFQTPIMTINDVAEIIGTTYNPAQQLVERFIELDILHSEDNRKRDRNFVFLRYLSILQQ